MKIYKSRVRKFHGSHFSIVHRQALYVYSKLKKKSKRRPYVRSAYFDKEKIFLDLYWHHLFEKSNWRDRVRRMLYYECAIELMQQSHFQPNSTADPNKPNERLYRFYGVSADNEMFCVLISIFSVEGPVFY